MHDDHALVEGRLARVLAERIRPAIYPQAVALDTVVWDVADGELAPVRDALAAAYRPAMPGEAWGAPWATRWFRFSGRVPQDWAGQAVEAVIDLGFAFDRPGFSAEALAYRADGSVVKGLNPRNTWLPVAAPSIGGEEVLFFVEAAANPVIIDPTGVVEMAPTLLGDLSTAGTVPQYQFRNAQLAVRDIDVWDLVQDLEVLGQLMVELDLSDPRRWEILRAIDSCLDHIDLQRVNQSAAAARERLAGVLARPAHASAHRISAVGHAHIDSAWLWPLRETVRKVARTVSNVVALMDDHPGFVFAMSQAQQFAWLKQHKPEVYDQVRKKVASGQFVPVGGMWVESDTNMPGGEALARQLVHGKRFFLDEFGIETEEVWLPDSFGYSAALPQLIRLSGSRWFLTQKLTFNSTNKFPHHSFWWEGIDGTRVFTHMPSVDTYAAELSGAELAHTVRNFADKGGATRSLVPFGYGDGGGGPTREMLARAARLADLEGSPRLSIEAPSAFFAAAVAEYAGAPVWTGELYLERHRGTYTSQAKTKQGNRRAEHLLREAELWAATAAVRADFEYPYEQLDRLWKTVLLHQFHDILPGSSIAWVHREAEDTYRAVAAELETIITAALAAQAGDAPTGATVHFNASPHQRDGVPALGSAPLSQPAAPAPVAVTKNSAGITLDNGLLRVHIDPAGVVRSLWDLVSGREVIAPGMAGNLLQTHPDLPNKWDAWDIESYYRNSVSDLLDADEVTVLHNGPHEAAVRTVRRFGSSAVEQIIALRAGTRRLDIDTEVDWHERETVLKASWPLDVHTDRFAAETQFGHVYRASHTNTSWDAAKFEICAHRFVHVGEPDYGVAIVNDSTYGHDITRHPRSGDGGGVVNTVRLTLLRAPRYPDPDTDQGRHHFRHAIAPGATLTDAIREGYAINLPLRQAAGTRPTDPLVSCHDDGVIIECVKLADDRSGDVVLRLYEALGTRRHARLRLSPPLRSATRTDLLERRGDGAGAEIDVVAGFAELNLHPFEIVTIRISS